MGSVVVGEGLNVGWPPEVGVGLVNPKEVVYLLQTSKSVRSMK